MTGKNKVLGTALLVYGSFLAGESIPNFYNSRDNYKKAELSSAIAYDMMPKDDEYNPNSEREKARQVYVVQGREHLYSAVKDIMSGTAKLLLGAAIASVGLEKLVKKRKSTS